MQTQTFKFRLQGHFKIAFIIVLVASLIMVTMVYAGHATDGIDAKITNDNSNVDGGVPNPGFDARNRQSNETTVAFSPADPNTIAVGANDYRMVTVTGDVWFGLYVSSDNGATWFNTFVPGFPSDTSAAGLASPLLGLDGAGDPVVRFDSSGNLYAVGIAFNRNFDQPDRPVDTVVYAAKYNYTYLAPIDPDAIERIEVVRGPASVAYGSDAQGGVVNVVTQPHPAVLGLGLGGALHRGRPATRAGALGCPRAMGRGPGRRASE